jgi:hypothetical protein
MGKVRHAVNDVVVVGPAANTMVNAFDCPQ